MKTLVFDTGPIISLTLNSLLNLLKPMKDKFNGRFVITPGVRKELIERPLTTKKFKFEALQVLSCINKGILEEIKQDTDKTMQLMELANQSFRARGHYIQIVQFAEISSIVAAVQNKAEAFVIDERTTRLLIEDPQRLRDILRRKLKTNIQVNQENVSKFREYTKGLKLIRSVEFVAVAYELGFLDSFLADIPKCKEELLEAVLWAVKLNGCAISDKDIQELIKIESKR